MDPQKVTKSNAQDIDPKSLAQKTMFKKWVQKSQRKNNVQEIDPTKQTKKTLFRKWAQKQIQTHLYQRRRKHKRAVGAMVVAVAAVVVAKVAAVTVVTAAARAKA